MIAEAQAARDAALAARAASGAAARVKASGGGAAGADVASATDAFSKLSIQVWDLTRCCPW